MTEVKAYLYSDPPDTNNDYYGLGECSDPVLIKRWDNSYVVGIFVVIDDAPEWRSCCGNVWDISKEVACWTPLPKMIV